MASSLIASSGFRYPAWRAGRGEQRGPPCCCRGLRRREQRGPPCCRPHIIREGRVAICRTAATTTWPDLMLSRPGPGPAPARSRRRARSASHPAAPGARAMFRDHENDRDHGTSPRSGFRTGARFRDQPLDPEHGTSLPRSAPGSRRDRVSPLNNQGSLSTSRHTVRDIARCPPPPLWHRCGSFGVSQLGGAVPGRVFVPREESCRVRDMSGRVLVLTVEGFRVPEGALSHEGGLSSYSPVNSPRCGNPPARTRKPSCESSLTPKEPHRCDIAGPARAIAAWP